MKKIILSTVAVLALSSSVMAFDLVDKDESIIIGAGFNVEGDQYNSMQGIPAYPGSPTAGRYGADKDMGYELSIGIEENVKNNEWGSRKIITLYNHGDAVQYDGNFNRKTTNYGLDFTYNVFYKFSKYFKPYVGAGFGINQKTFDGEGGDITLKTSYEPTLNGTVGLSGNVFKGLGYYAEYKYRLADHSTQKLLIEDDDGTPRPRTFDIDGVHGGQFMVGLNYKF